MKHRYQLLSLLIATIVLVAAPMLLLMLAPTLGLRATLWLLLAAWAAWFAVALFDPRRRALHDIVAGTELRRLA